MSHRFHMRQRVMVGGRHGSIASLPRRANGNTYGVRFDDGAVSLVAAEEIEAVPTNGGDAA